MKKSLHGVLICALIIISHSSFSQRSNSESQFHQGRENWFPNRGNVGIGTRTPDYDLEVIGDIRATDEIRAESIESEVIKGKSFLLYNNGIINGKLGIGVSNPTERLDILGNIKLQGNLTAQGLSIQTIQSSAGTFNTLTVSQNSIFNGLVGIGTNSPTQKLHVVGNAFIENEISSNSMTTTLFSTQRFTTGFSLFNENATFAKDAYITGRLGVGVAIPTEALDVQGNFKSTGEVKAQSINASRGNFDQDLNTKNATIAGDLNVSGQLNGKTISLSNIFASENVSVGQSLAVNGPSNLHGNITVDGTSTMNGDVHVTGTLHSPTISIQEINSSGSATIAQNLTVTGSGQIGSDLNVTGNIKAGIIEANEFRRTDGSSGFNFDNAVISQTLLVGSDRAIPSNYKLAVGGNIIATGIDIKIPQKWPDYVFTDGYKLLTIEEVEGYIKKYGHLPGVLSAKDMEAKENYNVGEMDLKLLEKIEELTLYMIELKKENQKLHERVNALEKR